MKIAYCALPLLLGSCNAFIRALPRHGARSALISSSASSTPSPSDSQQPEAEESGREQLEAAPNGKSAQSDVAVEAKAVSTPPPPAARPSTTASNTNDFKAAMAALGTSPRRIFLSTLSASGIALAGNFLGVTSRLLTAVPEDVVEASYLDTYFPRGDFKRCRGQGYTFVIPSQWVADTFVELAKAQRRIQPLDYTMSSANAYNNKKQTLPDAAYGPPGRLNQKGVSESGDTNVSVIVTGGLNNFSLQRALGTAQEGAAYLLRTSIAPEGSGRQATLLDAFEDASRKAYQFEYLVERSNGAPPLRNISVVAVKDDGSTFYTLTVVAPASEWEKKEYEAKLRKIAESFHLTS